MLFLTAFAWNLELGYPYKGCSFYCVVHLAENQYNPHKADFHQTQFDFDVVEARRDPRILKILDRCTLKLMTFKF